MAEDIIVYVVLLLVLCCCEVLLEAGPSTQRGPNSGPCGPLNRVERGMW